MKKKRAFKISEAAKKASYAARAKKRAATMARKKRGKAILAKAPAPRTKALLERFGFSKATTPFVPVPVSKSQAKRLAVQGRTAERMTSAFAQLKSVRTDDTRPFIGGGIAPPTDRPWTENEAAMKRAADVAAVEGIVKNLADSYDLDIVLTAIRDKVQRLRDEVPFGTGDEDQENYDRGVLIMKLTGLARLTRRMGWAKTKTRDEERRVLSPVRRLTVEDPAQP